MSQKRFRLRFTFWLDLNKRDEFELAEQIDKLKENRNFVQTVRQGIHLITNLRAGRLDILFELFPWVKAEFLAGLQPEKSPGEKAIEEQLKRLEALMREQGSVPVRTPTATAEPAALTGPKQLTVPQFAAPVFDDADEIILELKEDTRTDASRNFVQSALSLLQ